MSKANKNDPLLPTKILDAFREVIHRSKSYPLDSISDWFSGKYSDKQLRTALQQLENGGYVESYKDSSQYNKQFFKLASLSNESDEVSEENIYEFVLMDLVELLSRNMNELHINASIFNETAQKHQAIGKFISVTREDALFFDDEQFVALNKLFTHSRQNIFSKMRIGLDEEYRQYYVFQVRLALEGFMLIALTPKDEGADLRYIPLMDVTDIREGDRFKIPEEQMNFINQELIQLNNSEIQELANK